MNQQTAFLEKLHRLKEELAAGGNFSDDQSIKDFFENESLTGPQLQMIRDYIKESGQAEVILSDDDREYLESYAELFQPARPLDSSDFDLYVRTKNGDHAAYEQLAAAYMPSVLDAAKLHKTEGIFLGDLVSEGSIGLAEGLASFSKPENAHAEIMEKIQKSIRLYLLEQDAIKNQDNTLIEKVKEMDAALDYLKEELGRKVYIEEVADYLHISENEVMDILKLTGEDIDQEHDHEEHCHDE